MPRDAYASCGDGVVDARLLHLGLGAFARAHTLEYTRLAGAAGHNPRWAATGFTGRNPAVAETLRGQGNAFHVVTRGANGDSVTRNSVLSAVWAAGEAGAWLAAFAEASTRVVTVTVTEKGYCLNQSGRLDLDDPRVQGDIATIRDAAAARTGRAPVAVTTAPARIAAGLWSRAQAAVDASIAVVSCDNLPGNGRVLGDAVRGILGQSVPDLLPWVDEHVDFVSSMVDRITPATTEADLETVLQLTGERDRGAVVTEPFSEWVLEDSFRGIHPDWSAAGAKFVADVEPHERRKLLLLNGAHSLLAYGGLARGQQTIAETTAGDGAERDLSEWWAAARPLLAETADDEIDAYTDALLGRFRNARIEHRLQQIAADGSVKLRVRVVPLLTAALAVGDDVPPIAARVLADWITCWRDRQTLLADPRADDLRLATASGSSADIAARALAVLDPEVANRATVVEAVARELDNPVPAPLVEGGRR